MRPSFYKQTDPRWASISGNHATVARNGCGPTSVANIASVLVRSSITPGEVFRYMASRYFIGSQGSTWDGITQTLKHFGINKFTVTSNAEAARESIKDGAWLIGVVTTSRWTRGGHFIVLYGLTAKDTCLISDSASSSDYRQKDGPWSEYKRAERMQWIRIDPKDYPKAPGRTKTTETFTMYVSDAYANIRKGPGTEYGVKAKAKRGTKLTLYSYKAGWYRIKSGKYKGYYIAECTLSKYEPYVHIFQALTAMNVRSGYTTRAGIRKTIPKGTKVKSSKRKGDWIYCPAEKGWICTQQGKRTYMQKLK